MQCWPLALQLILVTSNRDHPNNSHLLQHPNKALLWWPQMKEPKIMHIYPYLIYFFENSRPMAISWCLQKCHHQTPQVTTTKRHPQQPPPCPCSAGIWRSIGGHKNHLQRSSYCIATLLSHTCVVFGQPFHAEKPVTHSDSWREKLFSKLIKCS